MAINKKLIHFKSKQKFNEELAKGNILETSIVFILETTEIYTHGLFYDGSKVDLSNIEETISKIKIDGNGLMYLNDKGEYKIPLIIVDSEEELNSITPEIGTRAVVRTVVEGFDNLNLAEIINGEETNVPADLYETLDKYVFKVTSVDTSILFPYLDGEHTAYELFTFNNGSEGFIIVTNLDGSSIPSIHINSFGTHLRIYSGNDYDFYWYDYNILERIITMTNIMSLRNKDQNVRNAFLLFSSALNVSIIANKEYTDYYYTSNGWVLSGYMTEQLLIGNLWSVLEQIPTKISQLENDANYTSSNNLKTINGESILGEGNITIEGGSSDTYYLELPLGEDGQCLSSGTITQEQFEEITSCKTLIVRTSNMSSDGISASEDIAFDWRLTLIEQSDEGEMKGIGCSNIYPNPFNNCLTSYIFRFSSNGSECIYELIAKQIFLGSDIIDPTAVDLSDNSIYELYISDNTESGEISEEEFNRIVASKSLMLNTSMYKITCIQRTAPKTYPDTYHFYGNFFDRVELKISLSLMRKDGVCRYTIQTKELNSTFDPSDIEASIQNIINNKQDTITDLEVIRQGAAKGATALQSYTEQYKGTVTGVKVNGTTKNPSNGVVDLGTVITSHQDISGKQDKLVSGTNIKTINGKSILGSGDIVISEGSSSGAYAEVNHGTSDTTFTLTPNTFHVWDEVLSLVLTLGEETNGVANEYLFQFTSGSTATTLSLPSDLKWANDTPPTIEPNMIYQVSILKGLASMLEFSNAVEIRENWLTLDNNIVTAQYPVASDLYVVCEAEMGEREGTIPAGETSCTVELPTGPFNSGNATNISWTSPEFDNEYTYRF